MTDLKATETTQGHRFVRAGDQGRGKVTVTFDGTELATAPGQSILVAIRTHQSHLRKHSLDKRPLGGFCLMRACQECWVWLGDGARVRACSTPVAEGMVIHSSAPDGFPGS